jgi:uncharacterized protein (TIGR00369 family)
VSPNDVNFAAQYTESPVHVALGLLLRSAEDGHCTVELSPDSRGINRHGNVSGGAIAAMIDSAIAQACRSLDASARTLTVSMAVTYLHAADPRLGIRAEGEVLRMGQDTASGRANVVDGQGRLCATGTATLVIRRLRDE